MESKQRLSTMGSEMKQQQLQLEDMLPRYPVVQQLQPYYRSKAFLSEIGPNFLIAAAAPLFFLTDKIQKSTISPQVAAHLHEDLIHELKAFDHQAQTHDYKPNMVMAAHYALCLWMDEMILNTAWGKSVHWDLRPLADTSMMNGRDNKSFFHLLNHCLQDSPNYIDLLELLYLCLSLGYEGEYRHLDRGYVLLTEIRDNVYQHIQRIRGEASKKLEVEDSRPPQNLVRQSVPWGKLVWRATSLVLVLAMILTGYWVGHRHLENALGRVEKTLKPWAMTVNHSREIIT